MRYVADARVGVIGLGYVGLPLAVEFGKRLPTVGFDINPTRVEALKKGHDSTQEIGPDELAAVQQLGITCNVDDLAHCTVFIVTVPTPIDRHKRPDLTPLCHASEIIATILKSGDTVIFESTVFPGATEEVAVPILERGSKLRLNQDFFVGYSPERINPGDKIHRLSNITKVTSGSTPEAADFIDNLYKLVVTAGTYKAPSIRVAEAAKVIENTQRDLNIALINELAIIFNILKIDTLEVLQAAGTKWNFLPFRPGLVGGHCIGVDPYYLTHKAEEIGYHPEVILAGRRINDDMGRYIVSEIVKIMNRRRILAAGSRILVLGLTFKEDCPDTRNSRVMDIVREFRSFEADVDVYDPWVEKAEGHNELGVHLVDKPSEGVYDAIVLAVAHDAFKQMGAEAIRRFGRNGSVLYDVKSVLSPDLVDGRL